MKERKIGLSLSGGGYRATAFHLGTLSKLQELGLLDKVDVLSTISGGSITGAAWCLHSGDYLSFHQMMINNLRTKNVIRDTLFSFRGISVCVFCTACLLGSFLLTLTPYAALAFPVLIGFLIILIKYQYEIFPVSTLIERTYDKFFFQGKKLKDLKVRPILAIGSSNLHTGRPFTFSRYKMADSSYNFRSEFNPPIYFKQDDFPVARAVMASSCVPFGFSPVHIDKSFFLDPLDYKRIRPVLIDGGVYDNQGIQKLTQPGSSYECGIIITSDAGGNFLASKTYPNVLALLIRTVDLFMYRIKAVQMVQHVYQNRVVKPITYFSLGWRLENILPGFIQNMVNGQILEEVLNTHALPQLWRDNPKEYGSEIISHLKSRIGYDTIRKRDLTETEWALAKNTPTNLVCLSQEEIDCLIRQAENLTEIQVKLYCPMILERDA